ncbi:hypothetical protein J4H92_08905 [Leucobacter weissii]|uniref:Uncharacterized protein n=1 Tax=Leucobacter weissii TaxID=1983706 RepID=A0A939MJU2_9MICO|nr:hypothetical protein [Leucobacter weissii]MBO1902063.1 hypothetical protein [Leucobacter weissii]
MGLFDRAKQAFSGTPGGYEEQARAAQQAAEDAMRQAGYSDGRLPTAADVSGGLGAQMQSDHDVLNAYGQELNRILAVGVPGTSVITSAVATGEQNAGNPWYQLEVQVTLPGQAPYTVVKREMIPATMLAGYAVGSAHDVRVDPSDPQKIAFSS